MRLNVMLNSIGLSGVVAAWSKGEAWKAVAQTDVDFDVAILQLLAPEVAGDGRVALVFAGRPYTARFSIAGPAAFEVQTFRFKTAMGDERFGLVCADCGCLRLIGADELRDVGTADCDRCGALPSGPRCPRGHNWGTCPDCLPSVREHSAMMHRAHEASLKSNRAEDGPPTKAGPSAPSLGSAGAVCESGGGR